MDMVGGGRITKALFRVHRGPASLPSFVSDVGHAWADFVNRHSRDYASTGRAAYPLVAPEGGKEPFEAVLDAFDLGSDHEVYTEGSFGIPAIYLSQWPDRYIHTNFDLAANIDPTVLKRAAFVGAASALTLVNAGPADAAGLLQTLMAAAIQRTAVMYARRAELPAVEAAALTRFHWESEHATLASLDRFLLVPAEARTAATRLLDGLEALAVRPAPLPAAIGAAAVVYRRNPEVRGPMSAFAYDYFTDHYGADRARGVRLLSYQGLRGAGGEYAYEALNFVNGRRTVQEIRDAVSAVYGPIPLDLVAEYLAALEQIEVVRR
jgi:hypothetical protein